MNNSHTELKSYTGSSRIRDRNDNKLVFDKVVQENPDAYPLFHSDRVHQPSLSQETAGCWYGAAYISCETLHLSIFILQHHAGKAKGASDGFRSRLSIQDENTIFPIEVIQISDAIAQPASIGCSSRVWVFPTSILQRKISRCIYVCIACYNYEASQCAPQI